MAGNRIFDVDLDEGMSPEQRADRAKAQYQQAQATQHKLEYEVILNCKVLINDLGQLMTVHLDRVNVVPNPSLSNRNQNEINENRHQLVVLGCAQALENIKARLDQLAKDKGLTDGTELLSRVGHLFEEE